MALAGKERNRARLEHGKEQNSFLFNVLSSTMGWIMGKNTKMTSRITIFTSPQGNT